ncbi:hypothetical protein SDC9_183905 [bioreactor metagenome]|uniref:Uncharacterized protein n=1 Tax=bioreactor metagenome TaxID=1076179 RepID=A0A645HCZ4_9ZZZZ
MQALRFGYERINDLFTEKHLILLLVHKNKIANNFFNRSNAYRTIPVFFVLFDEKNGQFFDWSFNVHPKTIL